MAKLPNPPAPKHLRPKPPQGLSKTMPTTVWVVGQWRENFQFEGQDEILVAWEMHGIFDTKEKAVCACQDENYFIGPFELNKAAGHEPHEWPGCYYPLEDRKQTG